jgi:hypothetical protein
MSRRITFFVLAASATLIATQASADRECFEDSCGQPEVIEPAASPMAPPAADELAESEASAPKLTPAKALPQVVATPQATLPQVADEPAPRRRLPPVQSLADGTHEPVRLAPRSIKQAPPPLRVTHAPLAEDVRPEPIPSPRPTSRPSRAAASTDAMVVAGPGAVYAEDDVVRVYPNPRPDPAWKLCQLDQRESDQRRCGAYSYHPFGASGYRPYGVYVADRGAPVSMVAPNAKIISIDSDD